MLISAERRWGTYEAPLVKVIDRTINALPAATEPQSGYLCNDIAKQGFSEREAMVATFTARELEFKSSTRRRLASQVCQRCVRWFDCSNKIESPDAALEAEVSGVVISTRKDYPDVKSPVLCFDEKTEGYFVEYI